MFRRRGRNKRSGGRNKRSGAGSGSVMRFPGKPARKKLPGWVIIPILAAAALLFWGISKVGMSGNEKKELLAVTVEKGNVKQSYNISGIVESGRTKVLYSPVNAPILRCNAKVGTEVKKGDKLITFDTTNLERDNEQSRLNELSARAASQDAAEQSERAASAAAQAKEQAAVSEGNLRERIKETKRQISRLEKQAAKEAGTASQNAENAEKLQQKMQENLDAQSVKKAEKENAERNLANLDIQDEEYEQKSQELMAAAEEATNAISILEQEYRALEQEAGKIGSVDTSDSIQALAAKKQELETLNASLSELKSSGSVTPDTGLTNGQRNQMQASEDLARLASLTTEELLSKGKEGIKADFDGIIVNVQAVEGSSAVQGGELFTLVSNKDVYVSLEVPVNDFENLELGNSAEIKLGKKTYQGKVESVDRIALPNAKGNPVIKARVHINKPDKDIYIGVSAKVSIHSAEALDVLSLPIEVINTASDGDFVYIIQDGTVKKQPVKLGVVSESRAEILEGLNEGDQVVSDTGGDIKEGMKAVVKEQ